MDFPLFSSSTSGINHTKSLPVDATANEIKQALISTFPLYNNSQYSMDKIFEEFKVTSSTYDTAWNRTWDITFPLSFGRLSNLISFNTTRVVGSNIKSLVSSVKKGSRVLQGSYKITISGVTTDSIPLNATVQDIQYSLQYAMRQQLQGKILLIKD